VQSIRRGYREKQTRPSRPLPKLEGDSPDRGCPEKAKAEPYAPHRHRRDTRESGDEEDDEDSQLRFRQCREPDAVLVPSVALRHGLTLSPTCASKTSGNGTVRESNHVRSFGGSPWTVVAIAEYSRPVL